MYQEHLKKEKENNKPKPKITEITN